jgi:AAA ATPase domain
MQVTQLIGRDQELDILYGIVDRVAHQGSAIIVRGEPGVGKSSLLRAASERASDAGAQLLRGAGVQSESHVPYSGLHQLLHPIIGGIGRLSDSQRTAPSGAFGIVSASGPDLFLIALAALELLADAAANSPVVLVVDDAQWLDRSTSDALAFIARRLRSEPIALLLAIRDGYENPLDQAGLLELRVEGLDDASASSLLDLSPIKPAPRGRNLLLRQAAGNPLALLELPASLRFEPMAPGDTHDQLPLTDRLESARKGWKFAQACTRARARSSTARSAGSQCTSQLGWRQPPGPVKCSCRAP